MAKSRMDLDDILKSFLNEEDQKNLYFNPPDGMEMSYPCIIYELINAKSVYADNKTYTSFKRYSITVIDKDPDSEIRDRLIESNLTFSFDRSFVSDHLNHYVFTIYF